jgi:hypothetical protein
LDEVVKLSWLPDAWERSDRIKAARPVLAERRDVGQSALSMKEDVKAVWSEATKIYV